MSCLVLSKSVFLLYNLTNKIPYLPYFTHVSITFHVYEPTLNIRFRKYHAESYECKTSTYNIILVFSFQASYEKIKVFSTVLHGQWIIVIRKRGLPDLDGLYILPINFNYCSAFFFAPACSLPCIPSGRRCSCPRRRGCCLPGADTSRWSRGSSGGSSTRRRRCGRRTTGRGNPNCKLCQG